MKFDDWPYYERNGGHMVTLTRAYKDASDRFVVVRDPADDDLDLMSQSTFVGRLWNLTPRTVYIKISGEATPHFEVAHECGHSTGAPGLTTRSALCTSMKAR